MLYSLVMLIVIEVYKKRGNVQYKKYSIYFVLTLIFSFIVELGFALQITKFYIKPNLIYAALCLYLIFMFVIWCSDEYKKKQANIDKNNWL